ncbi:MAG: hypothetical protein H8D42_04885, partial [Candidatus Marinimicrobia bacterium]|nr:hypothetical protein [Candidatus Neomarinimicrobiota bacterium]
VDTDDLMIITAKGLLIRQPINTIRTISRNTQGVRLIRLDRDDSISSVRRILESNNDREEDDDQPTLLSNEEEAEKT